MATELDERAGDSGSAPGQPSESAALADTGTIQPGQTKSITVMLKKGVYELFCNVPGHYAAGQKTTITVS